MADAIQALAPYTTQMTARPNEKIFSESEVATHAYIIERGVVRLATRTPQGSRFISDFVLAGEAFGIIEQNLYLWNAEAITEVQLLKFSRTEAADLLTASARSNGLLAHAWDVASDAWRFLRTIPGQTSSQRVAAFLIRMSQRTNTPIGKPIDLPISLDDIAAHIVLKPAEVSSALGELARQRVIEFQPGRSCTILNATTLLGMAVQSGLPKGTPFGG
jgi:CRP-like cAMP-binding protein